MFTLYEGAVIGSLICLGGQGLYLLHLKRREQRVNVRRKKRRKHHDQRARAGRDIGTQAGRDIHYYPPVLGTDNERMLKEELDLVHGYLMDKTLLCQEYMGMWKEERGKAERLQAENERLWKEVLTLKSGEWDCPVLRIE
jgi:hypothetical protein